MGQTILAALIVATNIVPLAWAWAVNRHTTLRPAVLWAGAAWASWVATVGGWWPVLPAELARYLALGLTSCAGVAVLGARRPGVGAWNFVVAGLLAVLLLPVAHGWGELRLHPLHLLFLSAALGVGVVNYLPTRLGPAAALVGVGCAVEVARLAGRGVPPGVEQGGRWCLGLGPWAGLLAARLPRRQATAFDGTWGDFRDRFGLLWGLRTQDQFNRAAANAGWPLVLTWTGLRATGAAPPDGEAALPTLRALLRRFGPPEE